MGLIKEIALFAGGTLFGSAGFKLLTSRDAKKAYVHATAAGLRVKDSVMATVEEVQENADDILASAKDLNLEREMREEAEREAAEIRDAEEVAAAEEEATETEEVQDDTNE
ncbi:MAG: DUF6110 family protein [Peptococcaceae bacterium]|nr:DUF6110 family protein [Peptococcaceae bacterium]